MTETAYCGIDPGREKFGLAVGNAEELLFSAVIPFGEIGLAVSCAASGDMRDLSGWRAEGDAAREARILTIYLGDGTGHRSYIAPITGAKMGYVLVGERGTTFEGRKLYWTLHPPSGLWRLIPVSLMTPGRPIDDLAAWIILKRGLSGR